MKLQTFKTYCPIFTGFYNTIFDESEHFLESELQDNEEFCSRYDIPEAMPWEYIENHFWDCIDYQAGNLAVAQAILDAIPSLFPNLVTKVTWEAMRSPREYNFANDSIDCEITVDLDALHAYLAENRPAFNGWLKSRYTSRSGFISSYSNDVDGWIEDTDNFTELDGHYLGSILDFIANEEMSNPEMDLYYAADGSEAFSNGAEVDTQKMVEAWREHQDTGLFYSVTGYYPEAPDEELTVLMYEYDDIPSKNSQYTDDDIYFYGVTGESLNAAIINKEELGDFIPTAWEYA